MKQRGGRVEVVCSRQNRLHAFPAHLEHVSRDYHVSDEHRKAACPVSDGVRNPIGVLRDCPDDPLPRLGDSPAQYAVGRGALNRSARRQQVSHSGTMPFTCRPPKRRQVLLIDGWRCRRQQQVYRADVSTVSRVVKSNSAMVVGGQEGVSTGTEKRFSSVALIVRTWTWSIDDGEHHSERCSAVDVCGVDVSARPQKENNGIRLPVPGRAMQRPFSIKVHGCVMNCTAGWTKCDKNGRLTSAPSESEAPVRVTTLGKQPIRVVNSPPFVASVRFHLSRTEGGFEFSRVPSFDSFVHPAVRQSLRDTGIHLPSRLWCPLFR